MIEFTVFDYTRYNGRPETQQHDYEDVMQMLEYNKAELKGIYGSGVELERVSDRVYSWWIRGHIARTVIMTERF